MLLQVESHAVRRVDPGLVKTILLRIGHNYIGHAYISHDFIGHDYIGHKYIGHKEWVQVSSNQYYYGSMMWNPPSPAPIPTLWG